MSVWEPSVGVTPLAAAGFAILLAITLAPLSELAFVHTGLTQLFAFLLARRPLACLAITPAVAFASFAQLALAFAGKPQFFALASTAMVSSLAAGPATLGVAAAQFV